MSVCLTVRALLRAWRPELVTSASQIAPFLKARASEALSSGLSRHLPTHFPRSIEAVSILYNLPFIPTNIHLSITSELYCSALQLPTMAFSRASVVRSCFRAARPTAARPQLFRQIARRGYASGGHESAKASGDAPW